MSGATSAQRICGTARRTDVVSVDCEPARPRLVRAVRDDGPLMFSRRPRTRALHGAAYPSLPLHQVSR